MFCRYHEDIPHVPYQPSGIINKIKYKWDKFIERGAKYFTGKHIKKGIEVDAWELLFDDEMMPIFLGYAKARTMCNKKNEIRFTMQLVYGFVKDLLKKRFPGSDGIVDPLTGEVMTAKNWSGHVRQYFKFRSYSSMQAIYYSNKVRTSYEDMVNGKMKPMFYCKELHDHNAKYEWKDGWKKGNKPKTNKWVWTFVTSVTPKKYKSPPISIEEAKIVTRARKGGSRGGAKKSGKHVRVK